MDLQHCLGEMCKILFVTIKKSADADIFEPLFRVIQERFSIPSCCMAISAMKLAASPEQMKQATPKLLDLLRVEQDCFVKCELLEALETKGPLDVKVFELAKQFTQDPVESVRLSALKLLRGKSSMDGFMNIVIQCTKDASFSVCQLAFLILNSLPPEDLDTKEVAVEVSALLSHRDGQIRLAAAEALSKMAVHGKDVALEALSANRPWPELELEVRRKKDEAIAILQKAAG